MLAHTTFLTFSMKCVSALITFKTTDKLKVEHNRFGVVEQDAI